jgi:CHASE3 domain sensor protein
MNMRIPNSFRRAAAILAATSLPLASGFAQDIRPEPNTHVVPQAELQQTIVAAGQQRQENLSRLERFFSGPAAEKALQTAHLNGSQIRNVVAMLDDQELARLAARADKANSDFAAGTLTNQELTYIVIALGTAVLILVIVAAR